MNQMLFYNKLDDNEIVAKFLSPADKMRIIGSNAIDEKNMLVTPVKIEFIVPTNTKIYPLQEKTKQLLDVIKTSNPTLTVISNNSKKWEIIKEIPQGKEFEQAFNAGYSAPARGQGKASIKLKISTSQKLAEIKYSNIVFSYLQREKIYLNYNAFDTKTTACPGFIIDHHSTKIRKDNIQTTVTEELKTLTISKNTKEVNQWLT
eukprot:3204473-Ditylum_brightwellii.AAC.1